MPAVGYQLRHFSSQRQVLLVSLLLGARTGANKESHTQLETITRAGIRGCCAWISLKNNTPPLWGLNLKARALWQRRDPVLSLRC